MVKICGVTQPEHAQAAAAAGAAMVGLVFAPGSPRLIDRAQAQRILALLPPGVEPVALLVDADRDHPVLDWWRPGGRVQRAGMLHGRQRAPHGQRLCPHQSWPSVYHTSSPTSVVTICPPMMLRGCASGESGRPNASTQLAPKGAISQTAPEACDSHAVMAIASPAPHNDTRVKGSDGAGGALDASLSLTRMMQPLAEWKTPQGY